MIFHPDYKLLPDRFNSRIGFLQLDANHKTEIEYALQEEDLR